MRHTDADIRKDLERAINAAGSLRQLARDAGLSPAFLSQVRTGRALPGERLAGYLGYIDDGKRWVRSSV